MDFFACSSSGQPSRSRSGFPGRRGLACALAGLALFAGTPAHADDDADRAREALRSGAVLPLARILDTVSRQFAGDVIDVKLDRDDGVWQYEVKLLTPGGSVAKLEYDASNAALLKAKGKGLERKDKGR